jgi:hypothetical protein
MVQHSKVATRRHDFFFSPLRANPPRQPQTTTRKYYFRPLAPGSCRSCLPGDRQLFSVCLIFHPYLNSSKSAATGPHGFPVWIRYAHFFNFLFLMVMRSGLSILMDLSTAVRGQSKRDLASGPLQYLRERVSPLCRCLESSHYC